MIVFLLELLVDLLVGLLGDLLASIPGSRRQPRSLDEMQRRHQRSMVRRALLSDRWADTPDRKAVVFVVANRFGLSFRDGFGRQELLIDRARISQLEWFTMPGDDRQYVAVRGHDGLSRIVFRSPDDDRDLIDDLTAALRA